jgi:hypothetical protein
VPCLSQFAGSATAFTGLPRAEPTPAQGEQSLVRRTHQLAERLLHLRRQGQLWVAPARVVPADARKWWRKDAQPSQRFSPRTVDLYSQRIDDHVVPTLGTVRIDELTVRRSASVDRQARQEARAVDSTGEPQLRRNALRSVHAAGEAAGLNGNDVEPVGLHDMRHSLVAGALDSTVTLAEAAVLARHANAKVTGAIYAGVSEKAKTQIAGKLVDAGFGS